MQKNFVAALLFLALVSYASAATYYLDANVGSSGDGTSWAQAKKTWTEIDTLLDALFDDGAGDTVEVNDGPYGAIGSTYTGVLNKARTDWLTIQAAPGKSPSFASITVYPKGSTDVHLKFDGLVVLNRFRLNNADFVTIQNCDVQALPAADTNGVPVAGYYAPYFVPWAGNIHCGSYCNNLVVQNCNIHDGYRGVLTHGNALIHGNTIHHVSSDGITFSSGNITDYIIENNYIYDIRPYSGETQLKGVKTGDFMPYEPVSMEGTGPIGIVWKWATEGYLIAWPTTKKTFFEYYREDGKVLVTGLWSGATLDMTGRQPDVPHTDSIERDTGTYDTTGLIIRNNIFDRRRYVGIGSMPGQGGKLFGQGTKTINNLRFENNIVDMGKATTPFSSQFIFDHLVDAIINNNTFIGNAGSPWFEVRFGASTISELYNNIFEYVSIDKKGYDVTFSGHGNNIFKTTPRVGTGQAFAVNETEVVLSTDTALENLFVSLGMDANSPQDFNLAPSSLAVNFGNPAYGPKTDILGNPRDSQPDAGAYEFQSGTQSVCGNNIKETGETCDGTDLAGQTCQSQGFAGGTLACTANCQSFNTSNCTTTECIDNNKLLDYLSQWKQGNITLLALMQKMKQWKAGTGCGG